MKQKLINRALFISKSLLWSLLLYVSVMAIVNWDDFAIKKNRPADTQSWVRKNDNGKELIPVKASIATGAHLVAYIKNALVIIF